MQLFDGFTTAGFLSGGLDADDLQPGDADESEDQHRDHQLDKRHTPMCGKAQTCGEIVSPPFARFPFAREISSRAEFWNNACHSVAGFAS